MKEYDDQSLFAWQASIGRFLRGPFAQSPAEFAKSGDIVPFRAWDTNEPFALTNKGLRLSIPVIPPEKEAPLPNLPGVLGVLACCDEGSDKSPLCIQLLLAGDTGEKSRQYARIMPEKLVKVSLQHFRKSCSSKPTNEPIFMPKQPTYDEHFTARQIAFWINPLLPDFHLLRIYPNLARMEEISLEAGCWIWAIDWLPRFGNFALLFQSDIQMSLKFVVLIGVSFDSDGKAHFRCSIEPLRLTRSLEDHVADVIEERKNGLARYQNSQWLGNGPVHLSSEVSIGHEKQMWVEIEQTQLISTTIYGISIGALDALEKDKKMRWTNRSLYDIA